jgi:hypothetical protein
MAGSTDLALLIYESLWKPLETIKCFLSKPYYSVLILGEITSCLPVSLHSAWTSTAFMIKPLCSFEVMEIDYQVTRIHSRKKKSSQIDKEPHISQKT